MFWASHQVCEALVPVAFGLVIDKAVRTGDCSAMIISVLGILALFTVLTMSWRTGMWFLSRATLEEAHTLRLGVVRRLLSDPGSPGGRQTGEQLSIATSDSQAAAEVLEVIGWLAAALVGVAASAVFLLRIDWILGIGILIGVPLVVLGLSALGPLVQRRTASQQQAVGLAAGTAADLLRGLRPLRGFGGVPAAIDRYQQSSQVSLRAGIGAIRASAIFTGATTFSAGVLLAAVAGAAAAFAMQGRISIGELITVVGLASFISDPVRNIGGALREYASTRASAARVGELLGPADRSLARPVEAEGDGLQLLCVSAPGVTGLTLQVAPGELIGVVAASTVAADSLVGLLGGRVEPEIGSVCLGGVPLAVLDPAARTRRMLVEPHVVDLFGETLRDALQVGDARSDDELVRALHAAALDDLAGARPNLDHELTDHGLNLSGGQRQRIALARALLADRPVLVLRDPTTAVDAVTESLIAERLRPRRGPDRATLIITTSPPMLARCDAVIFLPGDRSAVRSTHAELTRLPDYAEAVLR